MSNQWELTDEEIWDSVDYERLDMDDLRTVAKAQARKLVGWLDNLIIGTTAPFEKRMTEGCIILDMSLPQWQELLASLGEIKELE